MPLAKQDSTNLNDLDALPNQDRVNRMAPGDPTNKTKDTRPNKNFQPSFGRAPSYPGVDAGASEAKKAKKKKDKVLMNDENWQLAQHRPDLYIPNKLPFFKTEATLAPND